MEQISTSRRAPFGSNPDVGEAGRATQRRILHAASDAFAEMGYARTTVESITDRAGCSRPTFYQYFSGKEDLHRRLAGRFGDELSGLLGRLGPITGDQHGRDELCRWLEGLTDVYDRSRAVADNFAAAVRTDDRMVVGAAHLSGGYRRSLMAALRDAEDAPLDLETLAAAVITTAYGACAYRNRSGDVGPDLLASALADFVHRSFFGPIEGVNLGSRRAGSAVRAPRSEDAGHEPDPGVRRGRGLQTRERLLGAAATAFGTLGYEGVRVDDIASEAGVSHGSFYRYFRDKDAVFTELVDSATDEVVELLSAWPLDTAEDASWWSKSYYDVFQRRGGVISCLSEARAVDLPCAARSRHATAFRLRTALDTRSFGDTDADTVICFALLESFPAAAYRYGAVTIDEAIESTAVLLHRAVLGESN